jgi:peptide deformylase
MFRMAARRILQLGDPVLREASCPVTDFDEARAILADLADTLHEFQRTHGFGRGISAIQIGHARRIIYLEFEGQSYSLVNPVYERQSPEKFQMWDDCFSFPGLLIYLERSISVGIRYRDANGSPRSLEAVGPLSELIQHEMDHQDGVLAIDRALDCESYCTREEYDRRLSKAKAR